MSRFVARHGLWTDAQTRMGRELARRLQTDEIDTVRFVFADQHGILRGKTLVAQAAVEALHTGVNLTSTLFAKDTSHTTVFPVFEAGGGFDFPGMQGGEDFVLLAAPETFCVLPWAPRTGWVLCDAYDTAGQPCPLATRRILQRALGELDALGFEFVSGLEVEFHVFRLQDVDLPLTFPVEHASQPGQPGQPPAVSLLTQGYQYLTEQRYDSVDALMALLRTTVQGLAIHGACLPLHSLEIEFGPSQFELTLAPMTGMAASDAMVLLRSAIKQVCRRHGYHATFMCRPRIAHAMSSGWHLHQSLRGRDGKNAFIPAHPGENLSPAGMHWLAGLLAHAQGAAVFSTPTINGYRRYRPNSLAPDRVCWGRDNRGAMLRVLGGAGQAATRIENRVGEPNANPYLYMAAQIFSGLDGLRSQLTPPPAVDAPYASDAPDLPHSLPHSLPEALQCLRADAWLCKQYSRRFVDYFCHIKEAELARFNQAVTEWEQREYFDLF